MQYKLIESVQLESMDAEIKFVLSQCGGHFISNILVTSHRIYLQYV